MTKIPSKEKLEEMYNTMSISAIKEELDCSQGTLYKWLAFYDIGRKDTKRKEQLPSKTQFLCRLVRSLLAVMVTNPLSQRFVMTTICRFITTIMETR